MLHFALLSAQLYWVRTNRIPLPTKNLKVIVRLDVFSTVTIQLICVEVRPLIEENQQGNMFSKVTKRITILFTEDKSVKYIYYISPKELFVSKLSFLLHEVLISHNTQKGLQ